MSIIVAAFGWASVWFSRKWNGGTCFPWTNVAVNLVAADCVSRCPPLHFATLQTSSQSTVARAGSGVPALGPDGQFFAVDFHVVACVYGQGRVKQNLANA